MSHGALVGREREVDALAGWLDAAAAGEPRLVLCGGEPGVGKTRLAEQLAQLARDRHIPVLWARAVEADGAPPYWPWRQVLRSAGRLGEAGRIAADLRVTADLGVLAPEVFPGEDGAAEMGGLEQRFRAFDAVTRFLRELATPLGLVVVLDDMHWADQSSLLLLEHLARDLESGRLLVFATYRHTEPALAPTVAELVRERVTNRLDLRGLTLAEVGRQLAAVTGRPVDPRVAARVHELTGGNPFFVGELALALGADRIPTTVVDAIGRRMDRLSPRCRHQLRAAAIVGREFSVALVAAVIGRPVLRCLEPLEEAEAAGLIERTEVPGRHRFVHALVRDAVEAGLPVRDRVRMHRAAAEAVEAFYAGALQPHLPDLVRHWAATGDDGRTALWAERAAEEALHRLAYEEAARLYRLALDVAQSERPDADRYRLLLALARALWQAGELAEARAVSQRAAEAAKRLGRAELVAEAVLVCECVGVVGWDRDLHASCAAALAGLDAPPTPVRARVLARLAEAGVFTGDLAAAAHASRAAMAAARDCGDPGALVAALRARHTVCGGPDGGAERAELASRLLDISRETNDAATQALAQSWRVDLCFASGDLDGVAAQLQEVAWSQGRFAGPLERWYLLRYQGALAQAQARFDEARRCADDAYATAAKIRHPAAVPVRHALLWAVDHHVGVDPGAKHVTEALGAGPGSAATPGHAFRIMDIMGPAAVLAEAGHIEAARANFLAAGPVSTWQPPPYFALNLYAIGVFVGLRIGALAEVAELREVLIAHRGQHIASGSAVAYYGGPVELYLGMAALHLGMLDVAVLDLEDALRVCRDAGAAGYAVEAGYLLASAHARCGGPDRRQRALALVKECAKAAAALGMAPFRAAIAELADELAGRSGRAGLTAREHEVAGCIARGLTNREIAAKLYISERTAENHVQHILTKLGFSNRSQISAWVTARET